MGDVLEFKTKEKTAKIKPEDIDSIYLVLNNGINVHLGEKIRYNIYQFLLKNNLTEYYIE